MCLMAVSDRKIYCRIQLKKSAECSIAVRYSTIIHCYFSEKLLLHITKILSKMPFLLKSEKPLTNSRYLVPYFSLMRRASRTVSSLKRYLPSVMHRRSALAKAGLCSIIPETSRRALSIEVPPRKDLLRNELSSSSEVSFSVPVMVRVSVSMAKFMM